MKVLHEIFKNLLGNIIIYFRKDKSNEDIVSNEEYDLKAMFSLCKKYDEVDFEKINKINSQTVWCIEELKKVSSIITDMKSPRKNIKNINDSNSPLLISDLFCANDSIRTVDEKMDAFDLLYKKVNSESAEINKYLNSLEFRIKKNNEESLRLGRVYNLGILNENEYQMKIKDNKIEGRNLIKVKSQIKRGLDDLNRVFSE